MRALVLINTGARRGAAFAETAAKQLSDRGVDVVRTAAERLTAWPELIDAHAQRIDCVIVGGGDGSLNFAAGSLLRHKLTLGVLPLGTANDFARTLGYPTDLAQACGTIVEGVDHRVDLGQVNDVYFLNVASLGFAVHARKYRSKTAKRWLGSLGYASSLYAAFRATRPFRAQVTCDDIEREFHSIQIAVGNGRYFGGGLAISEDAALDDGKLDLLSLDPQSMGALVRMLPALFRGPVPSIRGGQLMQGTNIRIETKRRRSINTDGEVLTRTPAVFRVLPGALTVRVPKAYADEFAARERPSGKGAGFLQTSE